MTDFAARLFASLTAHNQALAERCRAMTAEQVRAMHLAEAADRRLATDREPASTEGAV